MPGAVRGDRRSGRIVTYAPQILELLARTPGLMLAELRASLSESGVAVGMTTLWRLRDRHRITLKNVWPAPSARVTGDGVLACINVSGLRAQALAKMDRARRGPHQERGAEPHIFDQAAATPDRPSRHLSFTSADLVRDLGVSTAAVDNQARMPTCRQT